MWELLLQLRVLLPYLARLVPLLDRGLLKPPDLSEITRGIAEMQTGSRDLEVQARNQALQLERIEQQMGRLRVVHENSIADNRKLCAEVQSLRRSDARHGDRGDRTAPHYGGNGRLFTPPLLDTSRFSRVFLSY